MSRVNLLAEYPRPAAVDERGQPALPLPLAHEGLHPERLNRAPEAVYARRWRRHHEHYPDALARIITPLARQRTSWPTLVRPTQRDATVAACVVQWLGTNCGQAFVMECEREAAVLRQAEHQLGGGPWAWGQPKDEDMDDAKAVMLLVREGRHSDADLRFMIGERFHRLRDHAAATERAWRHQQQLVDEQHIAEKSKMLADHAQVVAATQARAYAAGVEDGKRVEAEARRVRTHGEGAPRAIAIRHEEAE